MSLTLHLGVIQQDYGNPGADPKIAKARKGKSNRPRKAPSANVVNTGDVATFLEHKYHVMEIFYEENAEHVADALAHGLAGSLESILMGAPPSADPFGSATSELEAGFRVFIDQGEMEALGYPGVPTQAALRGVNHRLKHPYAKDNPARPSFLDTGLYQASFKAWVDT